MIREGYIYFMTNKHRNVLYVGVTSNLRKRIWEHRFHIYKNSFTAKYNLELLIYYEGFASIEEAILREKQIKKWRREKKELLIDRLNPLKMDLYEDVMNEIYSLLQEE